MATLVKVFVQSPPASGRTNMATKRNAAITTARTTPPRSTHSADLTWPTFSVPVARTTLTASPRRPCDGHDAAAAEPEQGDDGQHERRHGPVLRHRLVGRGPGEVRGQDRLDEADRDPTDQRGPQNPQPADQRSGECPDYERERKGVV